MSHFPTKVVFKNPERKEENNTSPSKPDCVPALDSDTKSRSNFGEVIKISKMTIPKSTLVFNDEYDDTVFKLKPSQPANGTNFPSNFGESAIPTVEEPTVFSDPQTGASFTSDYSHFLGTKNQGIFVQGTLRVQYHQWDQFNPQTPHVPAKLKGYKMFKSCRCDFPYILKSRDPEDCVQGDFIQFNTEEEFKRALKACDRIEGFNEVPNNYKATFMKPKGLYSRKSLTVELQDSLRDKEQGSTIAYVQIKESHDGHYNCIKSGSWHQFKERNIW